MRRANAGARQNPALQARDLLGLRDAPAQCSAMRMPVINQLTAAPGASRQFDNVVSGAACAQTSMGIGLYGAAASSPARSVAGRVAGPHGVEPTGPRSTTRSWPALVLRQHDPATGASNKVTSAPSSVDQPAPSRSCRPWPANPRRTAPVCRPHHIRYVDRPAQRTRPCRRRLAWPPWALTDMYAVRWGERQSLDAFINSRFLCSSRDEPGQSGGRSGEIS